MVSERLAQDEQVVAAYAAARQKYGQDIAHEALRLTLGERDATWARRFLLKARELSMRCYTDGADIKQRYGERRHAESLPAEADAEDGWHRPVVYLDMAELVTLWRVLRAVHPRLLSYAVDDAYAPMQSIRRWRAELRKQILQDQRG